MNFFLSVNRRGNNLLVKSIENGKRQQYKHKYAPKLFVKSDTPNSIYKTIHGEDVKQMDFASMSEAKKFTDTYGDVSNFMIYGMRNYIYPFINECWRGTIDFDKKKINIGSLDIETMSDDGFPDVVTANKEITVITVRKNGKSYVFGQKGYVPHKDDVKYVGFSTEEELLRAFVTFWKAIDLDIVTGWYIRYFDIPYLVNRISNILGEDWAKKLSPWEMINHQHDTMLDAQKKELVGIAILDYMELYKKWSYTPRESYTLDFIANEELGIGKLDYSEYGSLHNLYEQNYQLYVEYNVRDAEIVDLLEEKMKFIELAINMAYDAKINYEDALTSVKLWDVIIHNYLMSKRIVVPEIKPASSSVYDIVGGHVKSPAVGLYRWVSSFDLNSLYPSLIMQYNISPDKFVEKLDGFSVNYVLKGGIENHREYMRENNCDITANGCVWKKDDRGFLAALMDKIYNERVEVNKQIKGLANELSGIENELKKRGKI